jgi:hypothetical protein
VTGLRAADGLRLSARRGASGPAPWSRTGP